MKVLIIAEVDHTGAGYALMQAINRYTDHEARAVSFRRSYLAYPFDVLAPDAGELGDLIEWADVLNVHDQAGKYLEDMPARPVVATYHGSWYRNRIAKVNKRDRDRGWIATCLTVDLSIHGPTWIGRPIEPERLKMWGRGGGFLVVHAPTNRRKKGTGAVIEGVRMAPGATLKIIENMANDEALHVKSLADVVVDQVGLASVAYGTNALEAWVRGIPVVSDFGNGEIASQFLRHVSTGAPFLQASTALEVQRAIMALQDRMQWELWSRRGWTFVRMYHNPEWIAARFIQVCELAIRGRSDV